MNTNKGNKMPLITCSILTYCNFKHIYEAIDSILSQTYGRIEIAIVDDGSYNFPGDSIAEYIAENKKDNIENIFIYHNVHNVGTVKNENIMLKHTKGRYIMELGQDDRLHDEHVCEDVVKYFLKTGAYVVASYRQMIDLNGRVVCARTPRRFNGWRIKKAGAEKQYHMIAAGTAIAGAGTYNDRRIYEAVGYYDEAYRLQEDGPFFLKMTRMGYKIDFLERVTFDYRIGAGVSSSPDLNTSLLKDLKRMYKKEIDPYMHRFSPFEKRIIEYQKERIRHNRKLKKAERFKLGLKYPDATLYRMIFSH